MNKEEKTKQIIKEAYAQLIEIPELNTPDFYIMPTSVYNSIVKKLIYLEDALKDARKSRNNLREVYRLRNEVITKLKKELKKS